ncbi:MAG: uroporphyrinogen-III synthase [Bernardetiaceae bacterium]|nr:uroporphyrinogen-III synthase [Bernardetiaceae bacterium]
MANESSEQSQAVRLPEEDIKSILISQPPPPSNIKSPYEVLEQKYNVKVDFRQFIEVQPIETRAFRRQKVNILEHTAIIFTSRNAVDHFFSLCKNMRLDVPSDMKYFCVSDQTANYLQKYITVRKRKVFTGERTASDLFEHFKKHKKETFLFPCSNIRKDDIPTFMKENDIHLSEAVIYETVASDLSDLENVNYDLIAFFSPSGIASLFQNFPNFKQNKTRIAAFGPTTAQAVRDHDLHLDIEAPLPNAPSMTGAIEAYIKQVRKKK